MLSAKLKDALLGNTLDVTKAVTWPSEVSVAKTSFTVSVWREQTGTVARNADLRSASVMSRVDPWMISTA